MNYEQTLQYIDSYTDYEKTPVPHAAANYDLRRVDELLGQLNNPHLSARSVHIAGTKGKGSTAALIASALINAQINTGLYTSPHLHSLRERIRINNQLISEADLVKLVDRIKPEVEAVNKKATYGKITTFELLTTLAFTYFNAGQVDVQVLEVGLGGKYDATNVINSEFCVITSISLDHTEILGDTLTQIANEKTGIIKPNSTVISSPQHDEARTVIEKVCRDLKVRLIQVGQQVTGQQMNSDFNQQTILVQGRLDNYSPSVPLLGTFQADNVATAVATLEVMAESGFSITKEHIMTGMSDVHWPGRFQILQRNPTVIVDGAHNPYSAQKLVESLRQYFHPVQAVLVIGASSDKDIAGISVPFASFFNHIIVTQAHHPRAMETTRIVSEFTKLGKVTEVVHDIPTALSRGLELAGSNDLVCFTGSLFIVGEAIEALKLNNKK